MSNEHGSDKDIDRLLKAAGRRSNPIESARGRVYSAAESAWQALPDQKDDSAIQPATNRSRRLAIAASLLATAAVVLLWLPAEPGPGNAIASLQYRAGNALLNGRVLEVSDVIHSGDELMALDALTVRTSESHIVTLAEGSRLRFQDAHTLHLATGRVYVDAEDSANPLAIVTATATVRDIGTQFDVATDADQPDNVSVAVRSGSIEVSTATLTAVARAENGTGRKLAVVAGSIQPAEELGATDPYWHWVQTGREPYQLAGSSVYDYLRWLSRDSGRTLRFRDELARIAAKAQTFQGQDPRHSDEITVDQALETTTLRIVDSSSAVWEVVVRELP